MAEERIFDINNIPKDQFKFVSEEGRLHDQKLDTKPVGYFRDAMKRFAKNKSSVVAAVIIGILVLFAIFGTLLCNKDYQNSYDSETMLVYYKNLLPRVKGFEGTGFWDGSEKKEISLANLYIYRGMEVETGYNAIEKVISTKTTQNLKGETSTLYKVRINSYYSNTNLSLTLTYDEYIAIQQWQDEHHLQILLPRVNVDLCPRSANNNNIWYVSDEQGYPLDSAETVESFGKIKRLGKSIKEEGATLIPAYLLKGRDDYSSTMRIAGDPGIEDPTSSSRYRYAQRTGKKAEPTEEDPDGMRGYNYVVRVSSYNYFIYKFGFEPYFAFGTNTRGFDIISRLANGARFSLLLALLVSVINLTIGAIYGAIEGYYGGIIDLAMERFSDIIADIPFMVVTVLFQLHLASKVGVVGSLIYAFILTGWIGMASRVRMQFYRFKNQEYVLAARTLGASDKRIIWRHIFPNSLGTIITGSILVIPGVIFSETSLSYLGIINLDSSTLSSVGSMLSEGQGVMTSAPHIVLFPALFIALLEISFNLVGNGLRDAFNPSLRGSEG